ncbi:MAG TPA: hypothetical protein VGQ94_06290 [Terriglobales bacterium]|nr:hypothetical protein [Terriglobales bacterium]
MEFKLRTISKSAIPEALSKVQLYRNLNEPEESESICHDILAVDPENQTALRLLGLSITDQFTGHASDRDVEVEGIFQKLTDPFERAYCAGLLYERRAKAQLRTGRPPQSLVPWFEKAMKCFEDAEKIAPAGNDDAILRWNRCVRILQGLPVEEEEPAFEAHDASPVPDRPNRLK